MSFLSFTCSELVLPSIILCASNYDSANAFTKCRTFAIFAGVRLADLKLFHHEIGAIVCPTTAASLHIITDRAKLGREHRDHRVFLQTNVLGCFRLKKLNAPMLQIKSSNAQLQLNVNRHAPLAS